MGVINIAFAAHVDAGKTTLTELMLYKTGAIRKLGSVDNGTAQTDFLPVERERGISVRAAVTTLNIGETTVNLIDTPGHADFSAEVCRALSVIDGCILILSAVEGVQAQTEIIFDTLRKHNIPTIMFINKTDRMGADVGAVYDQIRSKLSDKAVMLPNQSDEAEVEQFISSVAEYDDNVAEEYILGTGTYEQAYASLGERTRHFHTDTRLYPVMCGSAICDIGIDRLIQGITQFITPRPLEGAHGVSLGLVFKVDADDAMGRIAHMRVFCGSFENRDTVTLLPDGVTGKITQIRRFRGERYEDAGKAQSGEIVGIMGLAEAKPGDVIVIGDTESAQGYMPRLIAMPKPLMSVSVKPVDLKDFHALTKALTVLNDEEPLLDYYHAQETGELIISITGLIQEEVYEHILRERFGIEVSFGEPRVIYMETPSRIGEGVDYYTMPKPCWAVLRFIVEPLEPGSGIIYECKVSPKELPYRYQNHVETAVPRVLKQGLKGWNVTDIKVTLVYGEYHNVHTHPLDFFVCTPMALMKALDNCGTTLLEPILAFRIACPAEATNAVIGELLRMKAEIEAQQIENDRCSIEGYIALSASMDMNIRLASASKGRAVVFTDLSGYRKCDAETIAPRRGVNPLDRSKFILWARNAL